jgi:branched-chain amino acid transport system permease protein
MQRLTDRRPLPGNRRGLWLTAAIVSAVWIAIAVALPDSHTVDLLAAAAIFALYVMSWAVFCGPALEASFGHTFFVGSVAYLTALLHVRFAVSPMVCLLLSLPAGALLGLGVAALTVRNRGLYFSMATMALQLTLYRCLFLYSPLFGGEEGIYGIRTIVETRTGAFAVAGAAAIAGYVVSEIYVRSRQGLLLSAIGHNERLAEATGVPIGRSRALALALSGALAALGGALYVFTIGQANVELAGDRLSARIVLLGMLGGAQSAAGPAVAAVTAYVLDQVLANSIQYTAVVMSFVLLLLVALIPRGLMARRPAWSEPARSTRRESSDATSPFVLHEIRRAFGGVKALNGVSFTLQPGKVTGIIGPNGAGKTTLLRVMAGEVEPDSGSIIHGSQPVRGDVSRRARNGLRKTFQHVESFGELTLREHLAVAMTVHGTSLSEDGLEEFLQESGIRQWLDTSLDQLSPAIARLTDIAMALAGRPKVVLLDEPFAGISAAEGQAVSNAVLRLRERGASVVVVEHRLKELFALADRIVVMDRGTAIAEESPEMVFQNDAVLAAYGTRQMAMEA